MQAREGALAAYVPGAASPATRGVPIVGDGSGVSSGAVAGGVVGGAVLLAALCVVGWLAHRRRHGGGSAKAPLAAQSSTAVMEADSGTSAKLRAYTVPVHAGSQSLRLAVADSRTTTWVSNGVRPVTVERALHLCCAPQPLRLPSARL